MAAPVSFQENQVEYDILNQCRRCGIKAGKYIDKTTGEKKGVFLFSDARGFKICNICKSHGYFIGKKKMTKTDKKLQRKMKEDLRKITGIPHVTVDAKGRKVV